MRFYLFVLAFTISAALTAQSAYSIDAAKSSMTLSGETNLSTWDEKVTDFKGSAQAEVQTAQLLSISKLALQIPVKSIEAPRKGMQKDTYEALKEDSHPDITFVATAVSINKQEVSISGNLTIAGTAKEVVIKCIYQVKDNALVLSGSHQVRMSNYAVEPPKAMLGTLQVEELVNISFSLVFTRS